MTAPEHRCWACNALIPAHQYFVLDLQEIVVGNGQERRGNWLAVTLCIECNQAVHDALDRRRRGSAN